MALIPLNTFKTKTAVLTTLTYDSVKCARDTGLMIDSIALDLLQNSTTQSSFAGLQYWAQGASKIPGETLQTLAALNRLKIIAKKVVLNQPVSDYSSTLLYPTQSILSTQIFDYANAGSIASKNKVASEIEILYNIIQNGTAGVSDLIIPNSTLTVDSGFINAANLLIANKSFLQSEITWWLKLTFPGRSGSIPTAYAYDKVKCMRDTGLIVDSLAFDLLFNSKSQSSFAGLQYWSHGLTSIPTEQLATAAAINYLRIISNSIIQNTAVVPSTGNKFTQGYDVLNGSNITTTVRFDKLFALLIDLIIPLPVIHPLINITNFYDNIVPNTTKTGEKAILNAINLLKTNREFIQAEIIAWIAHQSLNNITPFSSAYQYDSEKCHRDVSYILDCICFDLVYSGNRQTIQAGVYYYQSDATISLIPTEQSETASAYNHLKLIMSDIISGTGVAVKHQFAIPQVTNLPPGSASNITAVSRCIDLITTIIEFGTSSDIVKEPISLMPASDIATTNAFDLILANKEFLKAEIIAYIDAASATTLGAVNNDNLCTRDVGYIIDCMVYDLKYTGNRQIIQAGVYYFDHSAAVSVVPAEKVDTISAYNYMKTLLVDIVNCTPITNEYQTEVRQDLSKPAIGGFNELITSTIDEIDSKVNLITSIINGGPLLNSITHKPIEQSALGELVEKFDAATSPRITINGTTVVIDPTNDLDENTQYYVTFEPGTFQDLNQNWFAGTQAYNFTTAATLVPPVIVPPFSPANNVIISQLVTPIILTFNKTVKRGTGNITITATDINTDAITVVQIDSHSNAIKLMNNRIVVITLVAGLASGSRYAITAPSGFVQDLSNNPWVGLAPGEYAFETLDMVAPLAILYNPASGDVVPLLSRSLIITFSENIKLGAGSVTLMCTNPAGEVSIKATTASVTGKILTLTVSGGLPDGCTIRAIFPNGIITDIAGNVWIPERYQFSTPDTIAPTATFIPLNGAVNQSLATNITVSFIEPVLKGSGIITLYRGLATPINIVQQFNIADIILNNNKFIITPSAPLSYNTTYTITFSNTLITDLAGNNWVPPSYQFGTLIDIIAPFPVSFLPDRQTVQVALGTAVQVTFSEAISRSTGTITIHRATAGGVLIATVTNASVSGAVLTIPTAGLLLDNLTYYIVIGASAVIDTAGNPNAPITDYYWSTPDTIAPTATFDPIRTTLNCALATNITVSFSEPVEKIPSATGSIIIHSGSISGPVFESIDIANINLINNQFIINPVSLLAYNTNYYCSFPAFIRDTPGNNAWLPPTDYWFGSLIDIVAPTGTFTPTDNATQVQLNTSITVLFSEPVVYSNSGAITIEDRTDPGAIIIVESIPVAVGQVNNAVISFTGQLLTIHPSMQLSANKDYFVVFPSNIISDLAGNAWAGKSDYNFFTLDTIRPIAQLYSPVDGSLGNLINTNIEVTFNEPITKGTNGTSIELIDVTAGTSIFYDVATSLNVSVAGAKLTINPTADLLTNHEYDVLFPTGVVTDLAGNAWLGRSDYNFFTSDTNAPYVVTYSPSIGDIQIAVATNIVLTFSELVLFGTGTITIRDGSVNGTIKEQFVITPSRPIDLVVGISGSVLTINPSVDLANDKDYYVVFPPGVITDLAGNAWAGTNLYHFFTPDTIIPTPTVFYPADGATGVIIDTAVQVTFSEAITLGNGLITIHADLPTGAIISVVGNATTSGNTLSVPTQNILSNDAVYYIVFAANAVKDKANNPSALIDYYNFATLVTIIPLTTQLWASGLNLNGQLGLGDTDNRHVLTKVPALRDWTKISCGYHTLALAGDGTVWSWGTNSYGQIGNGVVGTNQLTPAPVGLAYNWVDIAAGEYHSMAINSDGWLYAWGENTNGQLGLNDTSPAYYTPTRVGVVANWASVSATEGWTAAIRTDGSLWTCGLNLSGQLGQNDRNSRSELTRVGSLNNWSKIACSELSAFAITTDGMLYSWGDNALGILGHGTSGGQLLSPVRVGMLTDWASISGGDFHVSAIKTDNTAWAWGDNAYGQLGNNTPGPQSSPTQIAGTLHAISSGGYATMLIDNTSRALWATGKNDKGELGLNSTTNYSAPVLVNDAVVWNQVIAGEYYTMAISLPIADAVYPTSYSAGPSGTTGVSRSILQAATSGMKVFFNKDVRAANGTVWVMSLHKNSPTGQLIASSGATFGIGQGIASNYVQAIDALNTFLLEPLTTYYWVFPTGLVVDSLTGRSSWSGTNTYHFTTGA